MRSFLFFVFVLLVLCFWVLADLDFLFQKNHLQGCRFPRRIRSISFFFFSFQSYFISPSSLHCLCWSFSFSIFLFWVFAGWCILRWVLYRSGNFNWSWGKLATFLYCIVFYSFILFATCISLFFWFSNASYAKADLQELIS